MQSIYYNRILSNFLNQAEDYMDYYLSHNLLKNNLEQYIDTNKFNKYNLNILDQYIEEERYQSSDSETDQSDEQQLPKIDLDDEQKLFNSIIDFINELKSFYKFEKENDEIIEDIFQILMVSTTGEKNRCMECNIDMGICNPRQLCGKWRCLNFNINTCDSESQHFEAY
tara:strand:- start:573 stop:1079 length:507 start_codon:yes stop_codon:yes gene_type:complete